MTDRYLLLGDVNDDNAIQAAFSIIEQLSKDAHQYILCISSNHDLEDNTVLGRILGDAFIKQLKKGRAANLVGGNKLFSKTTSSLKAFSLNNAAVIAMFADQKMLDLLDAKNPKSILVLPWKQEKTDNWRHTWNPEILEVSQDTNADLVVNRVEQQPKDLITDPIVLKALKALTGRVHTKTFTTFHHNEDAIFAKKCFGVLRKKKHTFDPTLVRNWVVKEGYTPKLADKVMGIAHRVNRLKNNPTIPREEVTRLYEYFKS